MRTLTTTPRRTNPNPSPSRTRGPLARARHAAAEIAPETIERIAQRVAQLLRHDPQLIDEATDPRPDLMNAAQLARHLGLTRAWVYEHANQLGAIQLGDGPRPRLRFDLDTATAAIERQRINRQPSRKAPPRTRTPRSRPRRAPTSTVPLLPIHRPTARGIAFVSAFIPRGWS